MKRLVVKVGTSTIAYPNGRLNLDSLERLVRQLSDIANEGREVAVVSSGAIGAGMGRLALGRRPKSIPELQAAAAVGQGLLMQTYEKLFSEYGHTVAQVLLTREDINDRRRHLNARHALLTLLRYGVIPIINENDTVAVDEIKFGDNDTLAALVTGLIDADLVILLSDVDGVYDADPRTTPGARRLSVVTEITEELERAAKGPGSALGRGGMATKIQAAKVATQSGAAMVIAHGAHPNVLRAILNGEPVGTLFVPQRRRLEMRKRWIAFFQTPQGELVVDDGARRALVREGKSLLPIGIVAVRGEFDEGDLVRVCGLDGKEIARGLVNYTSRQVDAMKGLPTHVIEARLGYRLHYDEVIHRDNLVLMVGWDAEAPEAPEAAQGAPAASNGAPGCGGEG